MFHRAVGSFSGFNFCRARIIFFPRCRPQALYIKVEFIFVERLLRRARRGKSERFGTVFSTSDAVYSGSCCGLQVLGKVSLQAGARNEPSHHPARRALPASCLLVACLLFLLPNNSFFAVFPVTYLTALTVKFTTLEEQAEKNHPHDNNNNADDMLRSVFITLALLISACTSFRLAPLSPLASRSSRSRSASAAASTAPATSRRPSSRLHAVLPGDPLVTGTLSQGVINGISIYSNIIFARIALSWFPQLPQQFPILKPIFTVTEPYLRAFRQTIPPVAGFDISAIPAVFILDILGQTAAAVGADLPPSL